MKQKINHAHIGSCGKVRGFRGQNAETVFPAQRLFDFPKCFDTTVKVVSHSMTKKVTENMGYLNPQRTRYLGVLVDIGNFWASLLLPLREQVSDGHSSGSLQDADSTLEIQGQENLRQAECCPSFRVAGCLQNR
jgi:hypothetical protein